MKEHVLVLFKPDVLAKKLMGHLLSRFNETGLTLTAIKMISVDRALAEAHYGHLRGQPFFKEIVDYLQGKLHKGAQVAALVYSGAGAIQKCRAIAGATNPEEADPKTIRGSLGRITTRGVYENVVHVSSDKKEAQREIKLWFSPDELGDPIFKTKQVVLKNYTTRQWA